MRHQESMFTAPLPYKTTAKLYDKDGERPNIRKKEQCEKYQVGPGDNDARRSAAT